MKSFLVLTLAILGFQSHSFASALNCKLTVEHETTPTVDIVAEFLPNNQVRLVHLADGANEYIASEEEEIYPPLVVSAQVLKDGRTEYDFEDIGHDSNWLKTYRLMVASPKGGAATVEYEYSDEYDGNDGWTATGSCTVNK